MNNLDKLRNKICSLEEAISKLERWKKNLDTIVFTNGCFDLVHAGHITMLANASDLGDRMIVGLNSDRSITKLKGKERPVLDEASRSLLLSSFKFIDLIILFDDLTPKKLIDNLCPDILVKGGDYNKEKIVGYKKMEEIGGDVITIPLLDGFSTTNILHRILKKNNV